MADYPIDKSKSQPLYLQLEQAILGQIDTGLAQPGDRLPSERELSEKYNISRQTVRQTINQLVLQGLLYRQQGKGTYVRSKKTAIGRIQVTGITRLVFDWSQQTTVWLGHPKVLPAPGFAADLLRIPSATPVVFFEHVQIHKGTPVNFFRSWVPGVFEPQLLSSPFSEASILDLLLNRCSLQITASRDRIEPSTADQEEAAVLSIPPASAVQQVVGCLVTAVGEPVEAHRSLIRADRFHLEFESRFTRDRNPEG